MSNIKDVAQLANVSTATVSRILTNTDNAKEETIKKVMEAVEELDYHPNVIGRQLRKMETKTILVVVPDITNTFFSSVLRGIEAVARDSGYQVLLGDTQNCVDNEPEYFKYLNFKQVDGIILLSARSEANVLEKLSVQYPVVLASEYIKDSKIATVSIDNIKSASDVTNYLIHLGHQRIAHITGPLDIVLGKDRLKGYQQSMLQNNLQIDPSLVQEGDFSYNAGYNITERLLSLQQPPTAIFSANDEMALGSIKAIKKNNLLVPKDVSVVGFDDIKMSSIFEPALTTFSQPAFDIGNKSMNLLIRLINKETIQKRQITLEGQLVMRESCGNHTFS